jgi:mannose-6-phosphate isomerase-like protein (cupin superfamily)
MKTIMFCAAGFALTCGMAAAQTSETNPLTASRAFLYERMPVTANPNGSEGRKVVTGTLATGEAIGIHESMQPVGMKPNPAHAIQHTEVIVVEQGTLEFLHDGKTERVGPGGIIYVAFGTTHAVKNAGDVPARYVVIQIGGDTRK